MKNKKIVVLICMLLISVVFLSGCIEEEKKPIDSSWFEGTWFNNQNYDDATIQLHFYNVFDDVIIYTRETGEYNWSKTRLSDFTVFHSSELYNDYRDYVLYIELPIYDNYLYLCTIWNDIFDIYYGENIDDLEYMRFYKYKNPEELV